MFWARLFKAHGLSYPNAYTSPAWCVHVRQSSAANIIQNTTPCYSFFECIDHSTPLGNKNVQDPVSNSESNKKECHDSNAIGPDDVAPTVRFCLSSSWSVHSSLRAGLGMGVGTSTASKYQCGGALWDVSTSMSVGGRQTSTCTVEE